MRAISALVLCGGRSARFGSDKSLALLAGRPLLTHVIEAARALCAEVLLVDKDPARYRGLSAGARLVVDRSPLETPLAGLEAGLAACAHETALLLAGDMPLAADAALIAALEGALDGADAAAPVAGGALQPLAALYRRAPCLALARRLLLEGPPRGVRALLDALGETCARVPWEEADTFLDADTPAALASLEQALLRRQKLHPPGKQ